MRSAEKWMHVKLNESKFKKKTCIYFNDANLEKNEMD